MVPQAGDEITDAISQQYLLDFNVAEQLKRDATNGLQCHFADIMGMEYDLSATGSYSGRGWLSDTTSQRLCSRDYEPAYGPGSCTASR